MNVPENKTNTFVPKQALPPTPQLYAELTGDCFDQLANISLAQIPPIPRGAVVHDNGCGTGPGTYVFVETAVSPDDISIKATDVEDSALDVLRKSVAEKKWDFVEIKNMDARELDFEDETFDVVLGNGLIFVMPDGEAGGVRAAREMYRTLKPGGIMIVNSFAYNPNLDPIQTAAKVTRPEGTPLPRLYVGQWKEPDFLKSVIQRGGFGADKIVMTQGEVYCTVPELNHFARMLWSFIGGTGADGWLTQDEENWEWALEVIKGELRAQRGFTPLEGGGAKLRFVANVAVATK